MYISGKSKVHIYQENKSMLITGKSKVCIYQENLRYVYIRPLVNKA